MANKAQIVALMISDARTEREINQQLEPLPYVIQKAPEFPEQKSLIPFKEQKNYITGKKLPQKKRRK